MSTVTEDIKARVDLVELIGRTVTLKRVGSHYRGLCPFHAEKTPSFYVRPQTQSWHCFGCGKHGTAFDWLMEREHLEFGEALRALAAIAGVALPERRDPDADEQARRLLTILERAQTYYQGLLHGSTGGRARAYLEVRGLNDETLGTFGIGYAPSGNGLLRYLEGDGFSEQELQAAGVIGVADDGRQFDFFRERVLFPIRDGQGRTIAFGGRSLDDGATPKYLNSRETLLFHKQETLFAFDLARKPMAQERQVVIVEGYMDAAMAHQHGYRNVVATLGTAVTDRHLRLLHRHVEEIVLALDADAAGKAATWRALQVADESLRTGLTPVVGPRQQHSIAARSVRLRVLALPNAKDPDELIRSSPTTWPALVRAAMPVVDFVLQQAEARHDLKTAQGKAAAAEEIAEVLAGIASPIEQDHYTNEAAARLNVEPGAVRRLLRSKRQRSPASERSESVPTQASEVHGDTDDDYLLALLMRLRELDIQPPGESPIEGVVDFMLPQSRELYRVLGAAVPPELEPYAERARQRLPDVERLPAPRLLEEIELKRLGIRGRLLEAQRRQLSTLLSEGGLGGRHESEDREEAARLLNQYGQAMGNVARQLPPERESAGSR
ncbi:MAG TPA: DNA primase [Chloroflexota bacterium]|nr:DNA primase [Chloroflexota bacterium]